MPDCISFHLSDKSKELVFFPGVKNRVLAQFCLGQMIDVKESLGRQLNELVSPV